MKKYSKIKLIPIFAVLFVLCIVSGVRTLAYSKSEYYSKVFRIWGLNTHTLADTAPDTTGYLLLLSSEFSTSTFKLQDRNVIICDTSFGYSNFFYCNSESVNVFNGTAIKTGLCTSVGQIKTQWGDIYIIPESSLYVPTKRDEIEIFIKALTRFSRDVESGVNKTVSPDSIKQLAHPSIFEISAYSVSILLLVSVLFKPLKKVVSSKESVFRKETFINLYREIERFSRNHRWILIYLFLGMIAFLAPVFIGFSYKNRGTLDLDYVMRFFISSLDVRVFSRPQETFKFIMFYYTSALVCIVLLLVTPGLINIIFLSINKVLNRKLNKNFAKYSLPTLIFLGFILSVFYDTEKVAMFLYVILFSIVYLCYLTSKSKLRVTYSVREKVSLLLIVILASIIEMGYKSYHPVKDSNYVLEPLIGISDQHAYFPYSKDYGKNALFEEYLIKPEHPLFLDYYLVYHPRLSKIQNKNVSDFENTGNYIILNSELNDISKFLVNNFEVLDNLKHSLSMNFGVKNLDFSLSSQYILKIGFDCSEELDPKTIYLKVFYNSYKDDVSEEVIPLINFPGCKAGMRVIEYRLPVKVDFIGQSNIIFNILGVTPSSIKSISFYKDNKFVPVIYFTYDKDAKIFLTDISTGDLITNYSFKEISERTFENELDSEFDLSEIINEFIKDKLLRNPFLIWFDSNTPIIVEKNTN
ncbi:MAG: hypothetical protein WAX66_04445 [Patescibacteria group bacterium]